MTKSFNKSEFVSYMSDHANVTKAEAERALNLVTDSIIATLAKGTGISLVGFGNFQVTKREAREGRNPRTGDKMKIAAFNQPTFRAGKKLKEACN